MLRGGSNLQARHTTNWAIPAPGPEVKGHPEMIWCQTINRDLQTVNRWWINMLGVAAEQTDWSTWPYVSHHCVVPKWDWVGDAGTSLTALSNIKGRDCRETQAVRQVRQLDCLSHFNAQDILFAGMRILIRPKIFSVKPTNFPSTHKKEQTKPKHK